MTDSQPSATTPAQRVAALTQHVIDLVEPSTRFDRSSMPVTSHETHQCEVTGTQTFSVSFNADRNNGRGKLAASVLKLANESELNEFAARRIGAHEQALGDRLHQWLRTQRELPGDSLTSADCYSGSETAGFEYTCKPCHGKGKTRCGGCGGFGEVTCNRCHGSQRVDCGVCNGKGETSCSSCSGRGQVGQHRERRVTNYADNTSYTESYLEWTSCSSCFGRGSKTCSCSHGQVSCTNCRSGKTTCGTCGGSGDIKCKNCDATGILNGSATLTCSVSESLSLQTDDLAEEPKSTIMAIDSLRRLCALTHVRSPACTVSSRGLARELEARMWLTVIEIQAAGEAVTLFGYGDRSQVFNFKNIVGALLKNDLEELERTLVEGPRIPLGPMPTLDAALDNFLQSEINVRVGQVSGGKKEALEKFARDDLRSAASADYVVRAARAVRVSVNRIFASEMVRPVLILVLIVSCTAALAPRFNIFTPHEAFWAAILVTLAGTAICEFRARSRLKARFSADLAPRAIALLKGTRGLWMWRVVAAGSSAVAVYASNYLAGWVQLALA